MLSESHFLLLRAVLELELPAGASQGILDDLRGEAYGLCDVPEVVRRRVGDAAAVRKTMAAVLEETVRHQRTCPHCALLHVRVMKEDRLFVPCRRCLERVPRDPGSESPGDPAGDQDEDPGATFCGDAGEEGVETFAPLAPGAGEIDPDTSPDYLNIVIPGAKDPPRRLPGRLIWTGAAAAGGEALRIERWTGDDPARWRALLDHLARLAQVDHPAVVRPKSQSRVTWCDATWVETRFVRPAGESLEVWLARGKRLPSGEATRIVAAVAEILQALWKAGIRTAGIILDDFLVDTAGKVRLVPSGLPAEVFQGQDVLYTPSGPLLGDFRIAPPEWWEGGEETEASVSFVLGAILLGLLRGSPLFAGPKPLDAAGSAVRFLDDPASALQAEGRLEERVLDVLRRLLDPDPKRRPGTIADAARELSSGAAPAPPGASAMPQDPEKKEEGVDPDQTIPGPHVTPPAKTPARQAVRPSPSPPPTPKRAAPASRTPARSSPAARPSHTRKAGTGRSRAPSAAAAPPRKPKTTATVSSPGGAPVVLPAIRKRKFIKSAGITLWLLDAVVVALLGISAARNDFALDHIRESVQGIKALAGRDQWTAAVSLASGAVGTLSHAHEAGENVSRWPEPAGFWQAQWREFGFDSPRIQPSGDQPPPSGSGGMEPAGEAPPVKPVESPPPQNPGSPPPVTPTPVLTPPKPAVEAPRPPLSLPPCYPQLGAEQPFLSDERIQPLLGGPRAKDSPPVSWGQLLEGDLQTLLSCLTRQVQVVHEAASRGSTFPVIPDWLDPLLDGLSGAPDSRFEKLPDRALDVRDHLRLHVTLQVVLEKLDISSDASAAGGPSPEEGADLDVRAPSILKPVIKDLSDSLTLAGELRAIDLEEFKSEVSQALRYPKEPERWKAVSDEVDSISATTQECCTALKALASEIDGLPSHSRLVTFCDAGTLQSLAGKIRTHLGTLYEDAYQAGHRLVSGALWRSEPYARRTASKDPDRPFHLAAHQKLEEIVEKVELMDESLP